MSFIMERCNRKIGFLNKAFELFGRYIPDIGLGIVGDKLTVLSGGEEYFVKGASCIVMYIKGIRCAAPARACFGYFDNDIIANGQDVEDIIDKLLEDIESGKVSIWQAVL